MGNETMKTMNPTPRKSPRGECTRCGQRVRLYVPRHGDGSILYTYWHKAQGQWCRSEVQDGIDWSSA